MASYRTCFGFNEKVLRQLKEKTGNLDSYKRHGGLLIDELKLSKHLDVKSSGTIEGFVDLGPFTTETDRSIPSDHGLVILFVPLQGKWSQVIGCFATNGNMKGNTLAKVVVEATILAEKSGLFVDFVTCDGASWNRNMWKILGIGASAKSVKCKVQHPTDASRHLFFVSDFPHLIKCLRNSLSKTGFNTPAGHVTIQHVKEAHKIDSCNITLKAMPGITMCHIQPNGFEKMRASYAFQLFGLKYTCT
ncbi:hypothetical protein HPB50_008505 [Hyalomma asiaticum]|uniref:Uncharacterized protein n=1 Tax=Hyalomma asiaticum TaxID=266040 RepID=A0ACB7TE65_HYAAI|nr:hypothetical protein HPB50_008505 [Hyalomma asiaticum]